jgi:Recombinase zinc beta ribbon domain
MADLELPPHLVAEVESGNIVLMLGAGASLGATNTKGEHPPKAWDFAQRALFIGGVVGGLLRCQPCGCAMTPAQAARNGGKRYRYYVCTAAQRLGWGNCPSKALPAAAVEDFVIEQLRALAADSAAWNQALGSTLAQQRLLQADKETEARTLDQELARLRAAYRKASPAQRVALQAPQRRAKQRRATLRLEISVLKRGPGSDSDRVQTLAALTNAAATPEYGQLVQRLVANATGQSLPRLGEQVEAIAGKKFTAETASGSCTRLARKVCHARCKSGRVTTSRCAPRLWAMPRRS